MFGVSREDAVDNANIPFTNSCWAIDGTLPCEKPPAAALL